MIGARTLQLVPRSVMRQAIARSHDANYAGHSFPFDVTKRRSLAVKMIIFVSIPFSIPFLVWRRRLHRNQGI